MVLGPILAVLWQPRAEGVEHVPLHGPAIMVGNHLSVADHFFGPLPVPRKINFIAKSDYFTGSGAKGAIARLFFRGAGAIPIDRAGGKASEAALRAGLKVLERGELLGIYPEGTRSPDGKLYRGKTGVARLILKAKVPVVPMAMINAEKIMPPGTTIPRLGVRPRVRFGEPLDFSRYYGMEDDHLVLRSITDEIMYALMRLSGQEYVDRYAKTVKEERARAAKEERKAEKAARKAEEKERRAKRAQAENDA
nr:lysophospholipid acyltransferase family protein [Nocardiopsis mwathae]